MPPTPFLQWPVKKLKRELSLRGAPTHGRKCQLIERLEAYERNHNFQGDPIIIPEPEPLDSGWPVHGFKQLQADHRIYLPKLTADQTEEYFVYRLAGDRQGAADVKALQKGKLLFEGKRILACSIIIKESIYLSGIVGAAMKNRVSYNFKLRICKKTADPLNSHCECPAGKGPNGTCKHLAAVLIMLEHFTTSGELQIGRSCTDTLQMFHKPKNTHKGNPIKAEDMPVKRKHLDNFMDDPRPMKYRRLAGFNDHFRNTWINFCSGSANKVAYLSLCEKADTQTASQDHDYQLLPFTEYWVEEALKVTDTDVTKIEKITRLQSRSKRWFNERRWRLTASRFGDICKSTHRRNMPKLCQSLMSPMVKSSRAMLHGRNHEKKALNAFTMKTNLKTVNCGLFICETHPFLGATPDAVINDNAIVEVKCPYNGRNSLIKPGPFFKFLEWSENRDIQLKKTSNYYFQIQGQLLISKREVCYFVVYTSCDLFIEVIHIDEVYCQHSLLPKLELFYTKYFRPYIASKL